MAIRDFFNSIARLPAGEPAETGLSRRDLLSGLGFVGALAVAGPALLGASTAEAAEAIESDGGIEAEITPAQYRSRRRRRHGRGPGRGSRRRHGSRRRRGGQRWAYRDLYSRCSHDWRFRRNNPGLCHRVLHGARPHRGACFYFGPVMFCG